MLTLFVAIIIASGLKLYCVVAGKVWCLYVCNTSSPSQPNKRDTAFATKSNHPMFQIISKILKLALIHTLATKHITNKICWVLKVSNRIGIFDSSQAHEDGGHMWHHARKFSCAWLRKLPHRAIDWLLRWFVDWSMATVRTKATKTILLQTLIQSLQASISVESNARPVRGLSHSLHVVLVEKGSTHHQPSCKLPNFFRSLVSK